MGWDSVRFCHKSRTLRAKPTRCCVYVYQFCDPEQAVIRCAEWSRTTVASVQRAVGPAAAGSLFSFSVTNNILGGNFVYVVLFTLVGIGLYSAVKLPKHGWTHGGR